MKTKKGNSCIGNNSIESFTNRRIIAFKSSAELNAMISFERDESIVQFCPFRDLLPQTSAKDPITGLWAFVVKYYNKDQEIILIEEKSKKSDINYLHSIHRLADFSNIYNLQLTMVTEAFYGDKTLIENLKMLYKDVNVAISNTDASNLLNFIKTNGSVSLGDLKKQVSDSRAIHHFLFRNVLTCELRAETLTDKTLIRKGAHFEHLLRKVTAKKNKKPTIAK